MPDPENLWRLFVDTGGTFTDCIAIAPDGSTHRAKILSSGVIRRRGEDGTIESVDTGLEAPIVAAHAVTGTPLGAPLPPLTLRLATTRGTNALLTRSGNPPALFVTAGFGDLLAIGDQQRPDLFAREIVKPAPLYGDVVEVAERLAADGSVLTPLDEESVADAARRLVAGGVTTAAVALLHAFAHPTHERRVAEILRACGFTHVSASADLAPFVKLVPRAQTAVVDAYLAPILRAYLDGVAGHLPISPPSPPASGHPLSRPSSAAEEGPMQRGGYPLAGGEIGGRWETPDFHVMTSAGGLNRASRYCPKDSLLSGPAGGVVGAARAGRAAGFERCIAFDMGGTSTDVARIDPDGLDYVFEHAVGDARLVAPALAIESVAAGGGSICRVDAHGRLRVGPESAGARPGPACYGMGGPLTVTDVNLLLGRLDPAQFGIPIDAGAAEARFAELQAALGDPEREALLLGLLDLADEAMADAIRQVSVRRGYDPAEYALVAFGGAGGMHAASVAGKLGVRTVVVPADAGLLSAVGLSQASLERFAERQVLVALAGFDTDAALAELSAQAVAAVAAEGGEEVSVTRRIARLRLKGQETPLELEAAPGVDLAAAFAERFAAIYGYPPDAGRIVEVESLRVVAGERPSPSGREGPSPPGPLPQAASSLSRPGGGGVSERAGFAVGGAQSGPLVLAEAHGTTFVPGGWQVRLDASGALVLTTMDSPSPRNAAVPLRTGGGFGGGGRGERAEEPGGRGPSPDPVALELFTRRFESVAAEMGEQLRRTALSVNVKERLDYSCALLGPDGDLVATAAHIPVHLGALGACVRALQAAGALETDDDIVVNHPAFGGSHLPDITVVSPVRDSSGALLGYVASRAHHAELGGTRPGSMPPDATTLAEEGVVLPPMPFDRDALRIALTTAPHPTRALADNLADLEAQRAANRRGADALRALAETHGAETLAAMRAALAERSERLVREALRALPPGRRAATEFLDGGDAIRVAVTVDGDGGATFDFSDTAAVGADNLNAPPAVTAAAALYVLRLLVDDDIPLNEGLLRAVTLVLPPGTRICPTFDPDPNLCPAVVGGNTEISQKVASALIAALELAAGSQGTMNNVLFGDPTFGYYETVCGGAGATEMAPGASAVHTHMTNTRITDPEILETRYPVRLIRFAIRRGSGGPGRHPGGDGVVREYEFLAPVSISLLTQSRNHGPRGAAGGYPGFAGVQRLLRPGRRVKQLAHIAAVEAQPGDRLVLETPGGGGWGLREFDQSHGVSVLMACAAQGDGDGIATELARGADVNQGDAFGWTALHRAVNPATLSQESMVRTVQQLLVAGADPNCQGYGGLTPLMDAAWRGFDQVVAALLAHGADPELRNADGETALGVLLSMSKTLRHARRHAIRVLQEATQ